MLAKPSVTLARRIKASPAKVFAAWTDPEKLVKWFGPHHTIDGSVTADLDVREGGRYQISFRTDDGEYHQVGGIYREVIPEQRLQFTWAWHSTPERESLVTVTVKPDGDRTLLTLLHEKFYDRAAADGHKRGWSGSLDKLEQFFA